MCIILELSILKKVSWFAVRSRHVYSIEIAYNRTDAKTLRGYICEGVSRWKKKTTRIKVQDYEEKATKEKYKIYKQKKTRSINQMKTIKNLFLFVEFYFCFFVFCFVFNMFVLFSIFVCFFVFLKLSLLLLYVCLLSFVLIFFHNIFFLNDFLWLFRQCVVLWVGVCRKWFCLF